MKWNAESDAYMRANYGTVKADEIGEHLGCNGDRVRHRAKRLGLAGVRRTVPPEPILCDGYAKIPLNIEGLFAIVDLDQVDRFSQNCWSAQKGRYSGYYAKGKIDGENVSMHALVLNVEKPLVVDHINGDSLDNRRSNLRPATRAQNCANWGHGQIKGIEFARGRWRTRINQTHVGTYSTRRQAAEAYNLAAIERYGEFACLNDLDSILD